MSAAVLESPPLSLAEKLSTEIERVREILFDHKLAEVQSLVDGAFVSFYAVADDVQERLAEAEKALNSGDLIRQIRAHVRLKEIKG